MEALIFNSSFSILINGSPTKYFNVSIGLRKGDPLSSFLLLLAADGLGRLMCNVIDLGEFYGFQVNEENHFELLQFADDTMLTGKVSWRNMWSINLLHRGFELVSSLCVNLFKKKIHCFNLSLDFIKEKSWLLACRVSSFSYFCLWESLLALILEERECGSLLSRKLGKNL